MEDIYGVGAMVISIHALCEEGDWRASASAGVPRNFYPRPLRGGRRRTYLWERNEKGISIHALCEEGDCRSMQDTASSIYFYPRPLRGGRRRVPGKLPHR